MRAWLNGYAYSAIKTSGKFFLEVISGVEGVTTIVSNIQGFSKKSGCGGGSYDMQGSGGEWFTVMLSTWTTGADCDTTASKSDIDEAARACLSEAKERGYVTYCCRLDHKGAWHADIRVCMYDNARCTWSIPCAY